MAQMAVNVVLRDWTKVGKAWNMYLLDTFGLQISCRLGASHTRVMDRPDRVQLSSGWPYSS